MVNRTITCALKSALLLLFLGALPEAWGQDRVVGDFDPRNLSGIWQRIQDHRTNAAADR